MIRTREDKAWIAAYIAVGISAILGLISIWYIVTTIQKITIIVN